MHALLLHNVTYITSLAKSKSIPLPDPKYLESRMHNEKHEINKTKVNSDPMVFDVPIVPNKINGSEIFKNGAVNYTALNNLVKMLQLKNEQ